MMKEILRKIYLWFDSEKWEMEKPFVFASLIVLAFIIYSIFYIKSTEFNFLRAIFICWFAFNAVKCGFGLVGLAIIRICVAFSELLDKAKSVIKTNIESYLGLNK